ncbi:hypothetical protein ACFFGT_28725 [Mucilaginibacter angelicae]|uniref:DUF4345 domain-containing protein n=1 Tax=Mucilaginibacter angelicae TaxID=869718 RepID=A0ABV6LFH7_9SPHI
MRLSIFFIISAILSFVFGAMMFVIPSIAAQSLGIGFTPGTGSLLQGMGGLIIGFGTISFLSRNFTDPAIVRAVLITSVITNALGLLVDILGVINGTLLLTKMAPVEITHIFIGGGSLIYLWRSRVSADAEMNK